ncbi:MAG: TetR/AcrR family transcriptional regulator [Micromonosporaceae bacterium]
MARTSLERIAERAGMSRATIYRRGVTVEALIAAVVDRAMGSFRASLWDAVTGLDTAAVRLRAAAVAILDATEQHLPVLTSMFIAAHGSGDLLHTAGPDGLTLDIFAAPFERILADGALDGSLRPVPPQVTATVLLSTTVWGYVHLRHCHDWPLDTARDAVIDLALRGVVPDVETAPTTDPVPTERGKQ